MHCFFESASDGTVTLHACEGGTTMVNGLRIGSDKVKLAFETKAALQLGEISSMVLRNALSITTAEAPAVWLPYYPWRCACLPLQPP